MKAQAAIQNLLRVKMTESQRTNPRFSLRAFSRKCGVNAGALSSILNGKRNVSRKLAERISEKLMLDPQERSEVLSHFPTKQPYGKSSAEILEARYLEFDASHFKIVAEWEHFAVMSLLNCEGFDPSLSWIASRLGVNEVRASQVLERLIQTGLLEDDDAGSYRRSKKSFRTSDDITSTSLKKNHDQSLELARESLYRDSVEIRDFTSVTMAIDLKKIRMAKELIRKFQDELSDLLESGTRTEVYRLSMQLFPLSKVTKSSGAKK